MAGGLAIQATPPRGPRPRRPGPRDQALKELPSVDSAPGAPTFSAWSPPPATRFSPERAALGRALGRSIPPLELGGGLSIRSHPLGTVGFEAASVVMLRLGAANVDSLAVALSEDAHSAVAAAAGAPAGAAEKDPDAAALMAEAALESALDGVEAALGEPVVVAAWSTRPPGGERIWIGAELVDGDGAPRQLAFGASPALAARLGQRIADIPAPPRNDRVIGLAAHVRFPPLLLSRAALHALQPGDAIFDQLTLTDLRLQIGPAQWRCGMTDAGVTKVGPAVEPSSEGALPAGAGQMTPSQADAPQAEGAPQSAPLAIAEAPAADADGAAEEIVGDPPIDARLALADIVLSVELARATLPLEEARRVGPGYVLPLGRGIGSEVDLMVSERRFGRGRLVEIDGEIAVEVLRLG